jgi:hypothetical protein
LVRDDLDAFVLTRWLSQLHGCIAATPPGMSAFEGKADMALASQNVRF